MRPCHKTGRRESSRRRIPNMRRFLLPCLLLLLVAATGLLWKHRYERIPGENAVDLSELARQNPAPGPATWSGSGKDTRLTVAASDPRQVIRLAFPGSSAFDALHLVVQVESIDLVLGPQIWDDGRLLVEWLPSGRRNEMELDPLASARGSETKGPWELVAGPVHRPAVPVIRIEHLGKSGEFVITRLEATPVRERAAWRILRLPLVAAWFALLAFAAGFPHGRWRPLLAAAIWTVFALEFIVPGPWKSTRPLASSFELGPASPTPPPSPSPPAPPNPAPPPTSPTAAPAPAPPAIQPAGRIPTAGSPMLRIKAALPRIRPLLHALMLFAPTLAVLFLISRNRTLLLGGTASLGVELAQYLFGFGFDRTDFLDLLWNAAGIALALWIHPILHKKLRRPPAPATIA
jgi:hypothetical protein